MWNSTFFCASGAVVLAVCPANTCFPQGATTSAPGAETKTESRRLWKPVADEVYLQEVGEKIATDKLVTAVAVYKDTAYEVTGGTLQHLRDGACH